MGVPRIFIAVALLAALAAGAAALAAWSAPGDAASGAFGVLVVGREGTLLNASVDADEATALSVLLVACAREGIVVETESYPGMGTYVSAIAGQRAAGASGWVYEVLRDGEWVNGDRSAERFALEPGDGVRWSWTGSAR